MTVRNIRKSLAVMQDLAQGVGPVTQQNRSGQQIDIPYSVDSQAAMTALDVDRWTRARVYSSTTAFTDYIYDPANQSGIAPDEGTGSWIQVVLGTPTAAGVPYDDSSTGLGPDVQQAIDSLDVKATDTYATVDAMKAAAPVPGQKISTIDYHLTQRGGGASYLIKDQNTATADGDVFSASTTGNILLDNGNVAVLQDKSNGNAYGVIKSSTTESTAQFQEAFDNGSDLVFEKADYKINSQVTIPGGQSVDFGNSNIYTETPGTEWAMLLQSFDASNRAQAKNFQLINVQSESSAPVESEWRHGLCLGGSNGVLENFRAQNYSGISLAMGNDSVYSTTCPASTRCYYWDVKGVNIASMYGVNLYIGIACNANHFQTFGTFPWNGFNQSPPRPANCIYEIQNLGKSNSFGGAINLEAAPSTNKVFYTLDCQNTVTESLFYCEHNASWEDTVTSIFMIEEQSAGNVFSARYAGVKPFIIDNGTANKWEKLADFYVNSKVSNSPRANKNLVVNEDFTGGFVAPWSTFSTGVDSSMVNVAGGFISGDSYTENYTSGRPNILQRIDGSIVNLDYLKGKTVTATIMVKSDIPNQVRLKIAGVGGNFHSGSGDWERVSTTARIPDSASRVDFQIIGESNPSGTGFVEISNCFATVGTEILDF